MSPESEFLKISGQRYAHLRTSTTQGCKDRRFKLTQFGRELPFSLEDFRSWLFARVGKNGVTQCAYCNCIIDLPNCEIDHVIPKANPNCTYGLDNLAIACTDCNQIKGSMTGEDFRALLALVDDPAKFTAVGRKDLRHRLQTWIKLANNANSHAKRRIAHVY